MRRLRLLYLGSLFILILGAAGCGRTRDDAKCSGVSDLRIEPNVPSNAIYPAPVVFDLKPANPSQQPADGELFYCAYGTHGKLARFRVELSIGRAIPGKVPVFRAHGRFLAVPGSDDTELLAALKTALEAEHPVESAKKVPELDFDAVVFGQTLSRDSSDGFSPNPPGNWTSTKIFLPKGGDKGEVFFNFNPVLGKGEFSLKDADYGDYVLRALASVL